MQSISKKIALDSELSYDFLANVHYLLYLCSVFWRNVVFSLF